MALGKVFKKLLIQEVALAGNPVNKEKFLIIKDDGGIEMNERIQLASFLLNKEDVTPVVKEELKKYLPKDEDVIDMGDGLTFSVKKDGFEFKKDDTELKKAQDAMEKLKKEYADLKDKQDGKDPLFKDLPKEAQDRLIKLEKDVEAAKKREIELKKDAIKKDLVGKVGEDMGTLLSAIYKDEMKDEVDKVVEKVVGLQKMAKDLGKPQGKTGGDTDLDKVIKDGVEKIMKDEKLEEVDAYKEFWKRNPNIGKGE